MEHTQNLINEGIPITGYEHEMKADELPFLAPPVLTEWEVFCRRQARLRSPSRVAANRTPRVALLRRRLGRCCFPGAMCVSAVSVLTAHIRSTPLPVSKRTGR